MNLVDLPDDTLYHLSLFLDTKDCCNLNISTNYLMNKDNSIWISQTKKYQEIVKSDEEYTKKIKDIIQNNSGIKILKKSYSLCGDYLIDNVICQMISGTPSNQNDVGDHWRPNLVWYNDDYKSIVGRICDYFKESNNPISFCIFMKRVKEMGRWYLEEDFLIGSMIRFMKFRTDEYYSNVSKLIDKYIVKNNDLVRNIVCFLRQYDNEMKRIRDSEHECITNDYDSNISYDYQNINRRGARRLRCR